MKPDIYDKIYERLLELCPDLRELKLGDYRKSVSGGYMDLHMNVLTKTQEQMRISLSHEYSQGGDQVPDPDMEIRVYLIPGWAKAEALTYQDTYKYEAVYPEPGKVYPELKKELNGFLLQWLKNIKAQGHSLRAPYTGDGAMHEDRGLDERWEREI
jgi:uncharacterized protein YqiB (DUF1249 family)